MKNKTIPYLKYKIMKPYTFKQALKAMQKGKIFFCDDIDNFNCFFKMKNGRVYSFDSIEIKWNIKPKNYLLNDQNLTDLKQAIFYKASLTNNINLTQG